MDTINLLKDNGICLVDIRGLGIDETINLSSIAGYDGATEISSYAMQRNITIILRFRPCNPSYQRQRLYSVFRTKKEGILYFDHLNHSYKIAYKVEKVDIPLNQYPMTASISLICPFPYFTDVNMNTITMSAMKPLFKFHYTFKSSSIYKGKTKLTGDGEQSPDNIRNITGEAEDGTLSIYKNGIKVLDIHTDKPLYGEGKIRDKVCFKNGKWGIYRYYAVYDVTGDEAIYYFTGYNESYPSIYHGLITALSSYIDTDYPIICNMFGFEQQYTNQSALQNECVYSAVFGDVKYTGISVNANRLSSYDKNGYSKYLKALYDNGTPIRLLYRLKNPTFEIFDEAAQDILSKNFGADYINDGFKFAERMESYIENFKNIGTVDVYPIIEFKALSALTNPSIMNIETHEKMKVNISMAAGDVLTIDTRLGKKSIIKNGSTNCFNNMADDFSFFKLYCGDWTIVNKVDKKMKTKLKK